MVIRNGPSLAIALTSSDRYGCSQSTNVTKTTLNNGKIKALDTIGNYRRPVFSLGVSHAQNNKPVKIWIQLVIAVTR